MWGLENAHVYVVVVAATTVVWVVDSTGAVVGVPAFTWLPNAPLPNDVADTKAFCVADQPLGGFVTGGFSGQWIVGGIQIALIASVEGDVAGPTHGVVRGWVGRVCIPAI